MKAPYSFFIFFLAMIFASPVFAQSSVPELMPDMRSRDIVYLGIGAHDREHYDSALAMFSWVHPNDTNYSWAVAEKANTMLAMERYEEAIDLCEKAVQTPNAHMGSMFMTLGTAYDEMEKSDQALEAYDRGIAKAPMMVRLHFNKAVTHVRREEYQLAYEKLQDALRVNPYHASSHFLLGMLALQQGEWVPGALATSTYLMLEPTSGRSYDALVTLNEALTEKTETQDYGIDFGENFRKVNLLVENYAALRNSYEVPGDLAINAIKQLHLIFKQMKINSQGFISNYYGTLFKDIVNDDKQFERFSYLILVPSKSESHQKTIGKNIEDVKKFASWTNDRWSDLNMYVMDTLFGETEQLRYLRYNDHSVQGIGQWDKNNDKPNGILRIYDSNGVLTTVGQFDKSGERTGVWKWYHPNGQLREVQEYVKGEAEGEGVFYDNEGRKSITQDWTRGQRNGKRVAYYPSGGQSAISTYDMSDFTGPYESFYPQGQTDYKVIVKEGQQDGKAYSYYNDGSITSEAMFEEGKRQGVVNVYYKNGKLKEVNNYEDDVAVGEYKFYYPNGQLKLEGEVVKGQRANTWKGYNSDGTLDYEEEYDESGKMTGVYRDYDFSGTMYHEIDYKKGEMTGYRYYDLEGNVIVDEKVKKDILNFTAYHPNRVIAAEGKFKESKKDGNWIYYNAYGVITANETFSEGEENGLGIDYYKDGTFKSQVNYKDGNRHGLYTEYYPDSTLYAQGRYLNDRQEGQWHYYNPDGSFRALLHLANGKLEGWQQYYTKTGIIQRENYVREGLILAYRFFGPNGDTLGEGTLEGGSGTITWKYPNGQLGYSANVNKGEYQGPIKAYHPNGQVRFEGQYAFDDATGEWKWYYANGELETVGTYEDDERHGEWKWYYEDGTRSTFGQYSYGNREGYRKDFDREGNIISWNNYVDGELHGKRFNFGEDSTIALVRIYRYGVITAYTYLDEQGNLIPQIPIVEGNVDIKSYYPNGNLAFDIAYKGGRYHGSFKRYFVNGKLMHQSASVGGRDEGMTKEYYSNGNVESEAEYIMDNIQGIGKLYHFNGKLHKQETFVFGSREGEALIYDENGKLVQKQIWFNDALFAIE